MNMHSSFKHKGVFFVTQSQEKFKNTFTCQSTKFFSLPTNILYYFAKDVVCVDIIVLMAPHILCHVILAITVNQISYPNLHMSVKLAGIVHQLPLNLSQLTTRLVIFVQPENTVQKEVERLNYVQ